MALTNYERVKRWREKNRALYNMRRRNARKNLPTSGTDDGPSSVGVGVARRDVDDGPMTDTGVVQTKIEELRDLVKREEEKPATEVVAAPVGGIYRNDHGGVISKFAWEKLQRMKEEAKKGGYEIDEYSQT